MKPMKQFFLAVLTAALGMGTASIPVHAAMPVVDHANLTQNVRTAIENSLQTLKQIQQYQTQLQQYETQLRNSLAPSAYIWDQATRTMDNLRSAIDTLSRYKQELGSIDAYLSKFQDVAHYRDLPCFSDTGDCTPADWEALNENRRLASESQKRANDAFFRGLEQQLDALQADARTLERLQAHAQGAEGQMQALGYANQLASQQANQLLQIRALLIAQHNALVTRMQAQADREAVEQAASEHFLRSRFRPSPPRKW